jgi:hypothetical protein
LSHVFRRRRRSGPEDEGARDDAADLEPETGEQAQPDVPARPQGPWDVDDAPDDTVSRLDLGGLRVPVPPETEVRVDVNGEGEVVAATLVRGPSTMQVNAFAAPKRSGIWDEVRAEIAQALVSGGGRAVEAEGPYGPELHGAVPVQTGGFAPARFVGVDGPRWFLRALLTGPAALDRATAAPLEAALRDVVVVRGDEAMAVRDPLPLRLPREVAERAAAASAASGEDTEQGRGLQMPERGPEITELR